jgi:hypothetical protein
MTKKQVIKRAKEYARAGKVFGFSSSLPYKERSYLNGLIARYSCAYKYHKCKGSWGNSRHYANQAKEGFRSLCLNSIARKLKVELRTKAWKKLIEHKEAICDKKFIRLRSFLTKKYGHFQRSRISEDSFYWVTKLGTVRLSRHANWKSGSEYRHNFIIKIK